MMIENLQSNNIFAVAVVTGSIILLIYFAIRTLITSNRFQKGIDLYQQRDYQGAEAAFRRVIAINSTNDVVHLFLGDSLMKQGKVTEAITEFKEIIDRAPKKAEAYLRLSNALMQEEKKAEAIINLKKAQELLQAQRQPQKAQQIEQLLQKISEK